MKVWGKITGKRKEFLSLICDGTPPYDACRKVWPNVKDVYGHVAHIWNDKEFREVHALLTDHQTNREMLLADCRRTIDDPKSKSSDRLRAIHIAGLIKGFIKNSMINRITPGRMVSLEDSRLMEKMADLGRKATDGHSKKPS